jgi:hypothetical protein
VVTVVSFKGVTIDQTDTTASFRHLALTPEQTIDFGLITDAESLARIERYLDSGEDAWSRDLDQLNRVEKIEMEALDPRLLRRLVSEALDEALDHDQLRVTRELEHNEREANGWA